MKETLGFVTVNGKKSETISVFDHGLLYGDGIYETIRVFNKKAFLFEEHLDRLFISAKLISLKMPQSKENLIKSVRDSFKKSRLKDGFIRIIITRGIGKQGLSSSSKPNVIIIINNREFKPLRKSNLTISNVRRINKEAIDSKIKSLNYLNNILAKKDALKKGFDDAVLLNDKENVTEATTSNLFIVKKNKIITPPSDSGILEGITRKAIIKNFRVEEKNLKKEDLYSADEIFLSGTVDFITSVKKLDNKKLINFKNSKIILNKLLELSKEGTKLE